VQFLLCLQVPATFTQGASSSRLRMHWFYYGLSTWTCSTPRRVSHLTMRTTWQPHASPFVHRASWLVFCWVSVDAAISSRLPACESRPSLHTARRYFTTAVGRNPCGHFPTCSAWVWWCLFFAWGADTESLRRRTHLALCSLCILCLESQSRRWIADRLSATFLHCELSPHRRSMRGTEW
jgi:hypothetical protein